MGENASISQTITQMVTPNALTLGDELLQTPRMTIADLMEASDVILCFSISKFI